MGTQKNPSFGVLRCWKSCLLVSQQNGLCPCQPTRLGIWYASFDSSAWFNYIIWKNLCCAWKKNWHTMLLFKYMICVISKNLVWFSPFQFDWYTHVVLTIGKDLSMTTQLVQCHILSVPFWFKRLGLTCGNI